MTKLHFFLLQVLFTLLVTSCVKEDYNKQRSQYIEAYLTMEDLKSNDVKPRSGIGVDVRGGITTIFIKSNVDFSAKWQDSYTTPWVKIISLEKDAENEGVWQLKIAFKTLSDKAIYNRRSGTILLSCPSLSYNVFVRVYQGLASVINCDFSKIVFGYADPFNEIGERSIDNWSDALRQEYPFTSTPFGNGMISYLYGKNGMIKLGNADGYGADIISWPVSTMANDSLYMVSFKAVAYTSQDGKTKDSGRFTLEILDGGVIREIGDSTKTSIELEAPNFDVTDHSFPSSMWRGSEFLVFFRNSNASPITKNTRIRIVAGNLQVPGQTCSRIYLDDFAIRPINVSLNEDYFERNGGNGRDRILGTNVE